MKKNVTIKLVLICLLMLALMIPLFWVQDVIHERQRYRDTAAHDIMSMWTGQQLVSGPLLQIPYSLVKDYEFWNKEKEIYEKRQSTSNHYLLIRPETLDITGQVTTQMRRRGIYEVPVYSGDFNITGQFSNQSLLDLLDKHKGKITLSNPSLIMPISDTRGVKGAPLLEVGKQSFSFESGTGHPEWSKGIHATLPDFKKDSLVHLNFSIEMGLRGAKSLNWLPVGKVTQIDLNSDWGHPSFIGHYLPENYSISEEGFKASWSTNPFSSDMEKVIADCASESHCNADYHSIGVNLIQPVDTYVQAERSSKYGLLFIVITFMAFFIYEVLKKMAVHPIQYGMVGLALTVFYLLLISLSEHLSFLMSYAMAGTACVSLLGVYVAAVLKDKKKGAFFAGGLGALYGMLYVIISSEDFALLMGALLLFVCLASLMLLTRKVDWYQLQTALPEQHG